MSSSGSGEYVPSPRPNPRLRPEGAAYAERNRGTMERWFDYSDALGSGDASTGAADGRATEEQSSLRAAPVESAAVEEGVRPAENAREAVAENSGNGKNGVMATSMTDSFSELSINSHRMAADEAKEYAERNRGQMNNIINNYGVTTPPAPSQDSPKRRNRSTDTPPPPHTAVAQPPSPTKDSARQRTLHQESQGRTWEESRPAQRIRPDGESIAMKNSCDSMFDIMRNDGTPTSSPAKTNRLSRQGEESLATPQSASKPRTRPGDGTKNYERAHNQSEMQAILRGESNEQRSSGRNIRHLQRSELW